MDPGHEHILENALATSFNAPSLKRQSLVVENTDDTPAPSTQQAPAPAEISSQENSEWKAEYDAQVKAWRRQSADARNIAEKERARWEALRELEKNQKEQSTEDPSEAGWEKVGPRSGSGSQAAPTQSSSSLAPALPSDSTPAQSSGPPSLDSHSRQDTGDDSQKWEDVPSSLTSSFPSMSFPETTETPPQASAVPPPPVTFSATLSIFDSSLSPATRAKALLSSLAINLLLPFVNGVMLGFGEIFAKNVVLQWMGWTTAPLTAAVGIRTSRSR